MKKEKKIGMVFCFTAISISLSAQDSDTTKKLNEVLVTATRTEKNVMDVGRSVTIIPKEDLEKSVYQNVGELLNSTEGIYVVGAQQNAGMNQTIFMRGTNSNHTVLMIDGVRITDPSGVNNAIDLSEISLSNIEQIEIVRGAHSTLYGSSAIGGVINIITRKPKDGMSGNINIWAGTFGNSSSIHTENAYLNYSKKGFFIGGEVFLQNVKGFDATIDTITNSSITKKFDTDNFSKLDWNLKAGYKNENTYGYFSFKLSNQNTDADKLYQGTSKYYNPWGSTPTTYYDGNYTLDFQRNLFTYGIEHKLNDRLDIKYYGGFSTMERTGTDDSTQINETTNDKTFFQGIYNGKVLSNEIQSTFKTKGANLALGISHYLESMNANTFYRYYNEWAFPLPTYDTILSSLDTIAPQSSILSGFFQADLNGSLINENLSNINLILGARMNNHSLLGNQLTYSINPSLKLDKKTLLFLSWSTGFNAPSLYQLYSPESNYQSLITRGNKSLKAETSTSFEIGMKKNFSSNLTIGLSIFSNTIDNAIEYVYLWNKNIGIDSLGNDWMRDDYFGDTYINIGKLKSRGIEFSIAGKISEKFSINANISMVNGGVSFDPNQIDLSQTDSNHIQLYSNGEFITTEKNSNILTRRPSTANITLLYSPITALTFGITSRFTDNRYDIFYDSRSGPYGALGQRPVNSYALLDATINYSFKKRFLANLRVENIADVNYQQTVGFTTRGRSIYFGLSYKF